MFVWIIILCLNRWWSCQTNPWIKDSLWSIETNRSINDCGLSKKKTSKTWMDGALLWSWLWVMVAIKFDSKNRRQTNIEDNYIQCSVLSLCTNEHDTWAIKKIVVITVVVMRLRWDLNFFYILWTRTKKKKQLATGIIWDKNVKHGQMWNN